jgi:hypothetical protein
MFHSLFECDGYSARTLASGCGHGILIALAERRNFLGCRGSAHVGKEAWEATMRTAL